MIVLWYQPGYCYLDSVNPPLSFPFHQPGAYQSSHEVDNYLLKLTCDWWWWWWWCLLFCHHWQWASQLPATTQIQSNVTDTTLRLLSDSITNIAQNTVSFLLILKIFRLFIIGWCWRHEWWFLRLMHNINVTHEVVCWLETVVK